VVRVVPLFAKNHQMKRNLRQLTANYYDMLVVGGGIYGASIAWDAALRGVRVCLVEKSDFSSGTSSNSLKIIHGGLRYLQHADVRRMRESVREQTILMGIAPHLIHPLPVLIPTYGHGVRGKAVLSLALLLSELINFDHKLRTDSRHSLPRGRLPSRREVMQLVPGIDPQGLTGGVIFYDAQVYNSERLVLSFLRSAEKVGAEIANYVEVVGFLQQGDYVTGVKARDVLTGDRFDIRARTVVNASGPWIDRVIGLLRGKRLNRPNRFGKAINLVTRPIFRTYAVGIPSQNGYRDPDAVVNKGNRLLFVAPWRDRCLIGTAYAVCDEDPDEFRVTGLDIASFLEEINRACPSVNLKRNEISLVHGGLVPISNGHRQNGSVQLAKHYQVRDHRPEGIKGLISVVGVKYTTARHVAEKVVDHVFELSGQKARRAVSSITPVHGGQIDQFDAFLEAQISKRPFGLGEEATRHLVYNYGSAYPEVLRYLEGERECVAPLDGFAVFKAEVLHGVRVEMAQKLSDVIFRRTELGTAGHPGNEVLRTCADIMSTELNWSAKRTEQELREVNENFAFAQLN